MRKSDDEIREIIRNCSQTVCDSVYLIRPQTAKELCTELLALREVERAARKLMLCSIFFKGFDKELLELMDALKELDNTIKGEQNGK